MLVGGSSSRDGGIAAAAAAPARAGGAAATAATTTVTTNAPVLRWGSSIQAGEPGLGETAIVALRVNVSNGWSTGEVRTIVLPSWTGLAVYEGPGLTAGAEYTWTVEERIVAFSNGTTPTSEAFDVVAGRGTFTTATNLPSARAEAAAAMNSPNMSKLWNGSWHSVNDRITPSGFLPTSVSGGYGGITQMYVRDGEPLALRMRIVATVTAILPPQPDTLLPWRYCSLGADHRPHPVWPRAR